MAKLHLRICGLLILAASSLLGACSSRRLYPPADMYGCPETQYAAKPSVHPETPSPTPPNTTEQ